MTTETGTSRIDWLRANWLRVALIVLAAALLLLVFLLWRATAGQEEPSPPPTQSASPTQSPSTGSPTPSPTATAPDDTPPNDTPADDDPAPAPPPAPGPTFTAFSVSPGSPIACSDQSASVDMTFSWSSTGAVAAWIGIDTTNAKAGSYSDVATSGSYVLAYQCHAVSESQIYTVTLEDAAGNLTHKTVTISQVPVEF